MIRNKYSAIETLVLKKAELLQYSKYSVSVIDK